MNPARFRRSAAHTIIVTLAAIVVLVAFDAGYSSGDDGAQPDAAMPSWLADHMRFLVGGTGWAASNAAYQDGSTEPYDAYTMDYDWGIGRRSVRGSLGGRRDDRDSGEFWEIRLIWDPVQRKARLFQFGADGTIAEGTLTPQATHKYRAEMVLHLPDGKTRLIRDELTEIGDREMRTRSFHRENGAWVAKRRYTWIRST